jgi:plasmid stabilization system protein ParE
MPGRRYGSELSNVGPRPGDEVCDVGAFVRRKGRIIPLVTAGENRTLVRLMRLFKSSFQALRIPNRTTDRPQPNVLRHGTLGRPSAVGGVSIRPLEAGCHAVVRVKEDPVRVARVLKRRASNCLPWTVVISWGQPKRSTQTDEGFSDCFGGDVRERECLRPTGVSIDCGEAVPEDTGSVAISDQYAHKRNVPT